jgi:hypothetical protein
MHDNGAYYFSALNILLLQTAQDIHIRLDKAIHGHVCLR